MTEPIPTPLVLVDRASAVQITDLLARLSYWLATETKPTRACAHALSQGETDDPIDISIWAEHLAGHLTETSDIYPATSPDPDAS